MSQREGLEHLLATLKTSYSHEELQSGFAAFLANFGFSVFTYAGLRYPTRVTEKRPVLSNFPENWVSLYENKILEGVDPVLPEAVQTLTPIFWDELLKKNEFTKQQREIFDDAKVFGLCHGLTIPVHGQLGDFAIVSVASDLGEVEFRRIASTFIHDIHIASLYYHDAIRNTLTEPKFEDDNVHLAKREIECLLWTARGKTTWEVSEILNISDNTVNSYLKNAMKKLGVFSKHHAVVRAIMLYLIFP